MKKIFSKILIVAMFFAIILLNFSSSIASSTEKASLQVKYEYNEANNQVTAKIVSNIQLKNTKPTWTLSNDKLTYSKVFTSNTKYSTPVQDINGNVINVTINVEQVKNFDLKVSYEYNNTKSQVTVKLVSNIEIKNTKPTWTLSSDKLTYSKTFTANTNYTTPVTDKYGRTVNASINVNQIGTYKAKVSVKYEYNEAKTQVTTKITSDVELKNTKPTWTLSNDKLTYSKVFTSNTSYTTPVVDKFGNTINVTVNVNQIVKPKANITVKYEYNESKNQVVAKIVSDTELKDTKSTWTLSSDKLTYSKIFTSNMNYTTPVVDKYGNIINVNIKIDQVKSAKISVSYSYNDDKNEVTVKMVSNMPLNHTKPTWTLSSDKLTYTKVFKANTNYTTPVVDMNGNVINVGINVTQIDVTPPEITVEYKFNDDDTVTVYMKSNEKLKHTKPTWTLSSDQMIYTKTFNSDQSYSTAVYDKHGIVTNVKIDLKIRKYTYTQDDNSKIKIRYLYTNRKQALVEIISSVKMANTKPTWTLSSDGYKYSKVFYSNDIYDTQIQYTTGKTYTVNIIVNLFSSYLNGIDVSQHQGKINWAEVKNSGIDFAIIRCGYGQNIISQDDTYFARNIAECERLGIPYGVYLYSYALTEKDALSEAQHVLRLIKGHNPTLGVWIDMEDADGYKSRNGMPSNATLVNICDTFCKTIAQNGYKPGVYASLDWLNGSLNSSKLDQYNKWVAQWNTSCSYAKKYVMWQYSSKGSVNGILTNVDMNIYYK